MPDASGAGTVIEGDVIVQGGDFVAGDKHVHIVEDPAAQRERRGQRILLEKVFTFWIEGVLHNNLRAVGHLDVRSASRPDLVAQPWQPVVGPEGADTSPQQIASLVQCFDDCQQALLLTGDPGSGKTTALLTLAADLIERARVDPAQPVPVVFNLATWGRARSRLEEWLVEELNNKYQIPRDASRRWLVADALLPMLDGLDEVAEQHRAECVRAINRFRAEHGLVSIVVCTRIEEYQRTGEKLNLGAAVALLPLPDAQIAQAVASQGAELADLQTMLAADEALLELTRSPLMLAIVAQVFRGGALPQAGSGVEPLLAAYVQSAFTRRGGVPANQAADIQRQLHYLAQKMQEHNFSIFLIELLQPGWLHPSSRLRYALLTRGAAGLMVGLFYLLLQISLFFDQAPVWNQLNLLLLLPCLLGGLAAGLVFYRTLRQPDRSGFRSAADEDLEPAPPARRGRLARYLSHLYQRYLRPVFNPQAMTFGLVSMLLVLLMNSMIFDISMPDRAGTVTLFSIVPIIVFLILTMIHGFAFPLTGESPLAEIDPVEAVRWSWRHARQGAVSGLVVSLIVSVVLVIAANIIILALELSTPTELLAILMASALLTLFLFLPLIGLPVAGIFAVLGGLRGKGVERGAEPNQGIQQSLRSARFSFLVSGLAGGVLFLGQRLLFSAVQLAMTGADPFAFPLRYPVTFLAFGLLMGGVAALRYGGASVLQHFLLRLLLRLEGVLPWRLVEHLEQAVSLALLRRAGSGYLFPHRVFLEYFASQPDHPQEGKQMPS